MSPPYKDGYMLAVAQIAALNARIALLEAVRVAGDVLADAVDQHKGLAWVTMAAGRYRAATARLDGEDGP